VGCDRVRVRATEAVWGRKKKARGPKRSLRILSCKPSISPRGDLRIRAFCNSHLYGYKLGKPARIGEAAERARLKKPFSTHGMQLLQIIVPKSRDLRESRHMNDPSLPKSSCATSICCNCKAWLPLYKHRAKCVRQFRSCAGILSGLQILMYFGISVESCLCHS
jgi:hypothetical protein